MHVFSLRECVQGLQFLLIIPERHDLFLLNVTENRTVKLNALSTAHIHYDTQ